MGKKKEKSDEGIVETPVVEIQKPRLVKLIVKNFRCIGSKPVAIDLDNIVVLVGANNVGKSSILKAYEIVMSDAPKGISLDLEDYPNHKIDLENLPQIELHLIVTSTGVGEKWRQTTGNPNEFWVREKWTWDEEMKSKKVGWNNEIGDWDANSYPFGPAGIANARRPEPHRVDAFADPIKQADEITKLLKSFLMDKVKSLKQKEGEENDFTKLLSQISAIQKTILDATKLQIDKVNDELTAMIEKVFPNHKVDFDAKTDSNNIDPLSIFFKGNSQLLMGTAEHLSPIDKQGSGARRTLLWTALKYISENKPKAAKDKDENTQLRPHLLLIDEPEICLHPNAIRDACNVLYELPKTGNWQVMVTTHSPIFIDFSRDNTTIIRVERTLAGDIQGTTVFRPDTVNLDTDDKKNLKMLNICDPYVAEFFFGGKIIVVEGDTEYTAFKHVIAKKPDDYKNVHIIRARGKATIVALVKILNHFGSNYSVLHDSDTPKIQTKKGKQTNGAWTTNQNILDAVNTKPAERKVRLLASIPKFEKAYFDEEVKDEKPYNALQTLEASPIMFGKVEKLLKALIDHEAAVPDNCFEWNSLEELESKVEELSAPV
jgi:putative ATP-dependent endonuclease of OLD family